MQTFIKKITSRKFLTCVAGVVLGICMVFGLDEGTINTVAGAVTSVVSLVIYIYTEGKIDTAAVNGVKDATNKVKDAVDVIVEVEE